MPYVNFTKLSGFRVIQFCLLFLIWSVFAEWVQRLTFLPWWVHLP